MSTEELFLPFWHHIEDLRLVVIKIGCILFIGMILAFGFSDTLIDFLTAPYKKQTTQQTYKIEQIHNPHAQPLTYTLPAGSIFNNQVARQVTIPSQTNIQILVPNTQTLAIFSPIEGMRVSFKVSFWAGFILTSPFWGWTIFTFIAPALHSREKRALIPFLLASLLAIAIACYIAWTLTIPLANIYLYNWNAEIGTNLWALNSYLDYTLLLLFANCIVGEIAVIGFFMVHYGFVSTEKMTTHRRGAILCAFIIATLLTPPDVLSQLLLAIPLILLYELLILYARFRKKVLISI